jgi:hypothetical protein
MTNNKTDEVKLPAIETEEEIEETGDNAKALDEVFDGTTCPPPIIAPSTAAFEKVVIDPSHTSQSHPHTDCIPDCAKPPKAPFSLAGR